MIGVGGFLGIGQHDIMVEMSKLKFVDEPVRTYSTTTSTTGSATTGTATRPATTATTSTTKSKWYPDHAVLSGVIFLLSSRLGCFRFLVDGGFGYLG